MAVGACSRSARSRDIDDRLRRRRTYCHRHAVSSTAPIGALHEGRWRYTSPRRAAIRIEGAGACEVARPRGEDTLRRAEAAVGPCGLWVRSRGVVSVLVMKLASSGWGRPDGRRRGGAGSISAKKKKKQKKNFIQNKKTPNLHHQGQWGARQREGSGGALTVFSANRPSMGGADPVRSTCCSST